MGGMGGIGCRGGKEHKVDGDDEGSGVGAVIGVNEVSSRHE
jgi:hypothetical protein